MGECFKLRHFNRNNRVVCMCIHAELRTCVREYVASIDLIRSLSCFEDLCGL